MVDEALLVFQNSSSNLDEIGRMLHESWLLKRDLSDKVSNSEIDAIYQVGRDNGAIGGKILGAGGGGFVLFYAPEECHGQIRKALQHLIEVDFDFEYGGSQIVLYNPDLGKTSSTRQELNSNPYYKSNVGAGSTTGSSISRSLV